jgi:hypothetical protein
LGGLLNFRKRKTEKQNVEPLLQMEKRVEERKVEAPQREELIARAKDAENKSIAEEKEGQQRLEEGDQFIGDIGNVYKKVEILEKAADAFKNSADSSTKAAESWEAAGNAEAARDNHLRSGDTRLILPVIYFVRICDQKNLDLAVEALKLVNKSYNKGGLSEQQAKERRESITKHLNELFEQARIKTWETKKAKAMEEAKDIEIRSIEHEKAARKNLEEAILIGNEEVELKIRKATEAAKAFASSANSSTLATGAWNSIGDYKAEQNEHLKSGDMHFMSAIVYINCTPDLIAGIKSGVAAYESYAKGQLSDEEVEKRMRNICEKEERLMRQRFTFIKDAAMETS